MFVRKPTVVGVEYRTVRMLRSTARGGVRRVTVKRWYIILRFGLIREKLAVSSSVIRWLQGEQQRRTDVRRSRAAGSGRR